MDLYQKYGKGSREIISELQKDSRTFDELNDRIEISRPTLNNRLKDMEKDGLLEPRYSEGKKKWFIATVTSLPDQTEKEVKQLIEFLKEENILEKGDKYKKIEINTDTLSKIKDFLQKNDLETLDSDLEDIDLDDDNGISEEDFVSVWISIKEILTNADDIVYDIGENGIEVKYKGDAVSLFAIPDAEKFMEELELRYELIRDDLGKFEELDKPENCDGCGGKVETGEPLYHIEDRDFGESRKVCISCRKKDAMVQGISSTI